MEYYDEDFNLLTDPDFSDKLIEQREVEGHIYTILMSLNTEQAEARRKAMAAMAAQPTVAENENALADLGAYVAELEARVAKLEGSDA